MPASIHSPCFGVKRLVAAVALALTLPPAAHAFQFATETGEVTGSFDTTLTVGGSWRAQGRDPALIGITNGGTARDVNSDDGNLNYDRGHPISGLVRATHELEARYRNYGMFVRGTYFFDWINDDRDFLGPTGKDRLRSDAELLDGYVRGAFRVADRGLNLRLGSQVVNWGESTFIPNGLNVINPIDLQRFRSPGAELREALRPVAAVWASQELSDTVTIEPLVLLEYRKTRLDPRGYFFSTTDALSDDGDKLYIGSGRRVDQHNPPGVFGVSPTAAVWAPRAPDREPRDSGQFGLALRWFAAGLNNTEFGFYALKYHSRTPFLSGTRGAATTQTAIALAGLDPGCASSQLINFNVLFGFNPLGQGLCTGAIPATYFADYPEDIKLYGASFNTLGPAGIAFQGEYSYRPNQPVQLATVEVILAAGGLANNITGGNIGAASVPPGTEITGYRRVRMHQVQVSATKAFSQALQAEQLVVVGEVGYNRQELPAHLLFAGPGVVLPAVGSSTATTSGSTQPNMEGYATRDSWGYRLLFRLEYPNAIGPVTVAPRLAFAHDVHGVSATFNQGTKATTLGVGFNYRQVLQADISYTAFFGGRTYSGTDPGSVPPGQSPSYATSANPLKDRDFYAVSLSYSF